MEVDSMIFDLDGTLWDSMEGAFISLKEVLASYPNVKKLITKKDLERCMGLQIADIGKKLFPDLSQDIQMQIMNEYCEAEQVYLGEHGGKLYPNLEKTLKELSKHYKLFLVSNCHDGYIQCFFKAHKLDKYFTDFECSGVTGLSKGENNKLIIKRNNLKNPVYVGDTIGDAESAKVAGIPFVYARYGFGQVEEYDYVIDSFKEILKLNF
ncbi:HAD family hydrolase [Clostridium guangxiense]|uniref:HAD family hydrolase n=1 Tax=Clostridium guangxiense TaxID=1662055 RepID=UPI001E59B748|nr:HAD family hydrolase [Clostridium guangxiense]MCD2347996.1 HAD family hydrolase [Clostridium guangxiense]